MRCLMAFLVQKYLKKNVAVSPPNELRSNFRCSCVPAYRARSLDKIIIFYRRTDRRIRERCHDFARSLFFSRYTRPRKRMRAISGACRSITCSAAVAARWHYYFVTLVSFRNYTPVSQRYSVPSMENSWTCGN